MTDLFEYADTRMMYRRTDPDTSRAAAEDAVESITARHRAMIMATLRRAGIGALAAEQIADLAGFESHVAVNRRLPELVRAGVIERTSEKHINRSGSSAYRYKIVVSS